MSQEGPEMIQNTSKDVAALTAIPPSPTNIAPPIDQQLADWDAYYHFLTAGKLSGYASEYVVIHHGMVVAHGADLEQLRTVIAERLGVDKDKLVVPFVDGKECIVE